MSSESVNTLIACSRIALFGSTTGYFGHDMGIRDRFFANIQFIHALSVHVDSSGAVGFRATATTVTIDREQGGCGFGLRLRLRRAKAAPQITAP